MLQYHEMLRRILETGQQKGDPHGVGNIAVCGHHMRFDVSDRFPLITTRSLAKSFKAAVVDTDTALIGEKVKALSGVKEADVK